MQAISDFFTWLFTNKTGVIFLVIGGVLLCLRQEGRGIGLAAKLKAETAAEAAELLGWEPEEIADPTATDGAYLSTYGVPTVDALSAIAEQIHTTEERVRIPSIRDRTALCAAMLGLLG